MFNKRNKKPKTMFSFYDSQGTLLSTGELNAIPIKEAIIIQKSIEFFNDPQPCYIHRGAVTVRLLAEIESYIGNMLNEDSFYVEKCNQAAVNYIDMDGIYLIKRKLVI